MPTSRMNREEFFSKLAKLDEMRLRKALWNLYWRGAEPLRERIEREIDPGQPALQQTAVNDVDPDDVLQDVRRFAMLARAGAYMGGDRRVTPRERSRWRFTFQGLVSRAEEALRIGADAAAANAMEQIIDLVHEMHDFDYVHSEDPIEAARFVVSDAVALLWSRTVDAHGFRTFADRAAPQLVRWESAYGWTRTGFGKVAGKETSLATVLVTMLRPDNWVDFADCYLDALDQAARPDAAVPKGAWRSPERKREERTGDLAEWHARLLERLAGSEADDRLDRLMTHPALGGPELSFLQAQVAHRRGDMTTARRKVVEALERLPGHRGFLEFATKIDVTPAPSVRQVARSRLPTRHKRLSCRFRGS